MRDADARCQEVAIKFARLMAAIRFSGAPGSIEMDEGLARVEHRARTQFANIECKLEYLRNADDENWPEHKSGLEGDLEELSRSIRIIITRLS